MELTVGSNSYISIEEVKTIAEDYITRKEYCETFLSLSDNEICKLVNLSTKLIDKVWFKGKKVDIEQPLAFPRIFKNKVVDCPEDIKIAIVMQAVQEHVNNTTDELQLRNLGVKSYKIDGASIEFNTETVSNVKNRYGVYSDIFEQYIKSYTVVV